MPDDRRPFSAGLRALVKKLATYTLEKFNGGQIGPKRTKTTLRGPDDSPWVQCNDPKCPTLEHPEDLHWHHRDACQICKVTPGFPCDAGLHS